MLVKATETCFIGGSRRRPGDVFEYDGKPAKFLIPVEAQDAPKEEDEKSDNNPLTDDELRVRLAEYGVRTSPNAKRARLLDQLAEAEGR